MHIGNIDQVTGDLISESSPLATFDEDYEDHWNIQRMTIQATDAYRIVFNAKTGGFSDDVIAIDDVSVQDKPCETGYFVVPDFTAILASAVPDETVIYSPTMYTDDGYAFRVKVILLRLQVKLNLILSTVNSGFHLCHKFLLNRKANFLLWNLSYVVNHL